MAYSADVQARACERRSIAFGEIGRAGELDGRARAAVQHADGMDRRIRRMDARQGNPMVAGDLPRNAWRRKQRHRAEIIFGGELVE